MGSELAHRTGVAEWAKPSTLNNSERDVHRTVKKQKTTLDISITELNLQGTQLSWINPIAWFQFIIDHGLLYMLSGLDFAEKHLVPSQWREFWTNYRDLCPGFSVFDDPDINFENLIALYVHGDEGRTLKRSALMVTSLQSVLGQGFAEKRLRRNLGDNRLHVNFRGHTFITRLVVSVMPKKSYATNPEFFHDTTQHLAEALQRLFVDGLLDKNTGQRYRFVVIGVKGDMPYLQKLAHLKRSWNTTVKRGSQRTAPPGVCHQCLGGTNGCPYEDVSDNAAWQRTVGVRVPWIRPCALLQLLPHDQSDPSTYLKTDLWHCLHLGVGKSFVASTLQLALEVLPCTNQDARYDWLTQSYHRWCRFHRKPTHTSKISGYIISYGEAKGAAGQWSKGALTTNLFQWLPSLLSRLPCDRNGFLPRCKVVAEKMNEAMGMLYNSPLFLNAEESEFVWTRGRHFVTEYAKLASECYHLNRPYLYPLYPKLHSLDHVFRAIQSECGYLQKSMNPLTASCQLDEDVIGRVSRVSRRVNVRSMVERTLQRHLVSCDAVWRSAGLLK
eukprot:Skav226233  [mRNA]  locus=scaffold1218:404091:405755:+ [translate_table: standard]